MQISDKGIQHIKQFEGFSSAPYLCPAGVWTIGYGHTEGVNAYTMPISDGYAEQLLREDVEGAEEAVRTYVTIPVNEPQFDALVSLVFNIGISNFKRSTLLKKLNGGDCVGAADEFLRWVFASGKKQRGLGKRRKIEREMFLSKEIPSPVGGGLGRGHSCSKLRECTVDAPLPTSPLRVEE